MRPSPEELLRKCSTLRTAPPSPSCWIKLWKCGEAAEGLPTDSRENSSERERHRDGETETPRKQQAYSLALGGFPNGLCVESLVHRMALLGGMEP